MHTLTYEEARSIIDDGDIVFIHGSWRDPVQAIIMLFTASPFSHVCIAFWVNMGEQRRLMCVEAQTVAKRRILSLGYYDDMPMTVISAPTPWKHVQANALSDVGSVKYGLGEAIYVGVSEFIRRLTGITMPNRDRNREYCSRFVADVYQLPVRTGSPQVLYDQLLTVSQVRVVN